MNVRSAGKRLLERLGMRPGFRPDWRQEDFLQSLTSRSASFAAFRRAHFPLSPLERIALFFRERSVPRFFVDATEIPQLLRRIESEHPSWKEATLRRVREECRDGLNVYVRRGPKLNAHFPWGGVERGPGGDKLYRKRPHRFAFAPRLALAALYGEPSDDAFHEVLLGWMGYASGTDNALAYDSNLAVIQRVLALSSAWSFLSARENPDARALTLEGLVLQVVHEDARFLAPRLGHSYPNNHLLADGFAGWFLGVLWPELCSSDDMRNRFEPIWLRELGRQTLADGSSFEHSTHYHEYACEMASAYTILSRRNGIDVPEWVGERTSRLLAFQSALSPSGTDTVRFGDAAEDPLFPLDCGDGWATSAWPDVRNSVFSAGVRSAEGGASRERAFWMLAGGLSRPPSPAAESGVESFGLGGYYIFHDTVPGTSLTFRTGPDSREACSPGHVHADLLSVYVTAAGRPFLVDAGTYTYRRISERWPRGEPDWRGYFSGPSAHNGLAIDGQDPLGAFDGDFRKELRAVVETRKPSTDSHTSWVDATLGGEGAYAGYRRGVIHVPGEYWIVYDVLPPSSGKARNLGFQFGADCRVARLDPRDVEVRRDDAALFVSASTGLKPPLTLTGSRDPVGGWVSRVYGELTPAPQVRFPLAEGTAASAFLVRIVAGGAGGREATSAIEVERLEPDGLRLDVAIGGLTDTLLVNFGSPEIELSSRGTRFRGELARVRRRSGRLELVHWRNGRSLFSPETGLGVESAESRASLALGPGNAGLESTLPRGLSIRWPGRESV
jgi:hypothetical protein